MVEVNTLSEEDIKKNWLVVYVWNKRNMKTVIMPSWESVLPLLANFSGVARIRAKLNYRDMVVLSLWEDE